MLRRTEPEDLGTIYRMLCELEETEIPFEEFKQVFHHNLTSEDNLYLVAIDERGELVGHFSMHTQWLLHHAGRVAEVQEIFVNPGVRGSGFGKALLEEGKRWAREKGCVSIEVTANTKRSHTHEFYTRNGFLCTHKKFTIPSR